MEEITLGPVREQHYQFTEPVVIRKWSSGSITAQVGYVIKHPEKNRIVLEKTWRGSGGKTEVQQYNINSRDWVAIKTVVERLLPQLAESPTADDIDASIRTVTAETELLELLSRYPELLGRLPEDLDILTLPQAHKDSLRNLLNAGGEIANTVIRQLAEQPIGDLEDFARLLSELRLSTINALVTHITSRLSFIDVFERAIHDDRSYERTGAFSIHNLLKTNIWIIDRNFSILHDDITLRRIIQEQFGLTTDPSIELRDRPDFLCMVDPVSEKRGYKKVIIIEIKRPSIRLTVEHATQVIRYKQILERYSGRKIDEFICYIISREIDPVLFDMSGHKLVVRTYTDFVGEARDFYREYQTLISNDDFVF